MAKTPRLGDTKGRDRMLAHTEAALENSKSSVRVNWGNEGLEVRTDVFRRQLREKAARFAATSIRERKPKSTRSK